MQINVGEARDKLTQLLQDVENGEEVTICRNGKPVADLVPTKALLKQRPKYGTMKDKIKINDPDWWKPQNDVEAWLKGDV